jgi:hypothetical protein
MEPREWSFDFRLGGRDVAEGTRFIHAEFCLFFDQFWDDGPQREAGTRGLLEQLGRYLA